MEHPMPSICWRTKYAAAFMDNGKMTIRYRFPYANKREAALLGAYNLTPADRLPYYQNLSAMIERNLLVTEYLRDESVPSIITFENAFQKDEENNIICVYCLPSEPVTPITLSLFAADCNALSTFNVFLRLTHILRDIHKTPMAPVLRYLDLDDVYLTSSERILLGGFYYASANDLQAPPHSCQTPHNSHLTIFYATKMAASVPICTFSVGSHGTSSRVCPGTAFIHRKASASLLAMLRPP